MSGTLNGHPLTRALVQVPAWGLWFAGVDLSGEVSIEGAVTLELGDATLSGTILSGGVANGRSAYNIVGGAGQWGREIAKRGLRNDSGVKAANVIKDVAQTVGEAIDTASLPTTRLGPHYARRAGPASQVLHELAPRAWWVGFDGVTYFGTRPSVAYAGDAPRTKVDPGGQVIELVTDAIVTIVPGVTIDGSLPATDVEYALDDKRLTARVFVGSRPARRLEAWRRIVSALFPEIRYSGAFEFRVTSQTGDRLNLQPVRAASGMPTLAGVPVRPGMAGLKATVALGSLVLVCFADRDPSRPQVFAHDATDAPGWMPLTLELGGPGALGVARMTDAVVAGPFGGTIVGGSLRVKAVI